MSNIGNLGHFKMKGNTIDIVDTDARAKNTEQDERLQNAESSIGQLTGQVTDLDNRTNENTENINGLGTKLEDTNKRLDETETEINNANKTLDGHAVELSDLKTSVQKNASAISTETGARTSADNIINQKVEQKADKADTVTNVAVTNENGVYTLSQTKDGTTSEIGTIETSKSNNPVVEVKDSVVENTASGYDFHTITETTEDGTENEVGKAYIAAKQVTGIAKSDTGITVKTVDQTGTEASEDITIAGGEKSGGTKLLTLTLPRHQLHLTGNKWPGKNEIAAFDDYILQNPDLVKKIKDNSFVYARNLRYVNPDDWSEYSNTPRMALIVKQTQGGVIECYFDFIAIGLADNSAIPSEYFLSFDLYVL